MNSMIDYNTCVDKIIQISPCYDLSGRAEKPKPKEFGYIQPENKYYNMLENNDNMILNNQGDVKLETEPIGLMGDFKFDGGEL